MDMREAFEQALLNVWGVEPKDWSHPAYSHAQRFWQAACEWQKQQDAKIVVFMKFDEQEEWGHDCEKTINQYLEVVKKDILTQGNDNGLHLPLLQQILHGRG